MDADFQPEVRTEETSEGRIVEIHVPGFRREDLKVQVNNRGSLVVSGERGVNEMDEMTKVGGGRKFRKVINVPENLNFDAISAKFRDEKLRVSLPLLHSSNQQKQDAVPDGAKPDQSKVERSSPAGKTECAKPDQSKVERSSLAGKQESKKEQPSQDDQSARLPEAVRLDDVKEKPSTVAAEESNKLAEKKKTEQPKQAEDLAGEPPESTNARTVCEETGSEHRSESIQSKSKQDYETALLKEDGGQKSGKLPECRHPLQEKEKEGCTDDRKPSEKSDHVLGKQENGDGIGKIIGYQEEGRKVEKGSCSRWRSHQFPNQKRIHIPASCTSTLSKRGVLIASSVLVLSVGLYITYRSRSRHRI